MISVVVPAHNEAAVIDRLLTSLTDHPRAGIEIIVVANGCTDDTAARARRYAGVVVLETPVGNKSLALNLGDGAATGFPRFYVDADVEVSATTLERVGAAMIAEHKPAGAPRPRFVIDNAGFVSRRFYRHYPTTTYMQRPVLGLGVYGVTDAGRRRFDQFPDATGDDLFIAQEFAIEERAGRDAGEFLVHVPRSARDLIKVRVRIYLGNWHGRRQDGTGFSNPESLGDSATQLAHAPERLSAAVYYGVNAVAKLCALSRRRRVDAVAWGRDNSSRTTVGV